MMKYRYFVSYSHTRGFGNAETTMNRQINSINDLNIVAREIEKDNGFETNSVVILYYKRFR